MSKLKQPVEFDVAQALAMGQAAYVEAAKQTIGTWWSNKKSREKSKQEATAAKRQRLEEVSSNWLSTFDSL